MAKPKRLCSLAAAEETNKALIATKNCNISNYAKPPKSFAEGPHLAFPACCRVVNGILNISVIIMTSIKLDRYIFGVLYNLKAKNKKTTIHNIMLIMLLLVIK